MQLDKIKATLKTGNEQLSYNNKTLDFSLIDFWRWSVSDILSNATRGRLAEFIVATALTLIQRNVETSGVLSTLKHQKE